MTDYEKFMLFLAAYLAAISSDLYLNAEHLERVQNHYKTLDATKMPAPCVAAFEYAKWVSGESLPGDRPEWVPNSLPQRRGLPSGSF